MGRESNNYSKRETVLRPDVKYYKRKNIYCWSMQKKYELHLDSDLVLLKYIQWPNFV